jgi:hypothetical protein
MLVMVWIKERYFFFVLSLLPRDAAFFVKLSHVVVPHCKHVCRNYLKVVDGHEV